MPVNIIGRSNMYYMPPVFIPYKAIIRRFMTLYHML